MVVKNGGGGGDFFGRYLARSEVPVTWKRRLAKQKLVM